MSSLAERNLTQAPTVKNELNLCGNASQKVNWVFWELIRSTKREFNSKQIEISHNEKWLLGIGLRALTEVYADENI